MENKKAFDINFIAPIILFIFVTFSCVEKYIIADINFAFLIYNVLTSVICCGLGMLTGYMLKVILLPMGKGIINSFIVSICTVVTDFLVSFILICLFKGIFEYPDMLVKASKALCFIFIAFYVSNILKKHILKKGRTGQYILSGVFVSVGVTLIAVAANAFWHYLSFNIMFDFVNPTPFSWFFTYDIGYHIGIIGTIRYPALFVITLLFFLTNVLLHKKGIDVFDLYQKKLEEDN